MWFIAIIDTHKIWKIKQQDRLASYSLKLRKFHKINIRKDLGRTWTWKLKMN